MFTGVNMIKTKTVLAALMIFAISAANAQDYYQAEELDIFVLSSAKHEQRLAARQKMEGYSFSDFDKAYSSAKNDLQDKLGIQVGMDISYTMQRSSPNGKQTAIQGIYYPYLTWDMFKNTKIGSGQLNVNYNLVRYWGAEASSLQGRSNFAVPFNDYPSDEEIFSQFSYTHTLPGDLNWLSFTVGQFPLYNFDGTEYLDNQQTALMNYALSQNASSAYPSASLGGYLQAQNGQFSMAAGYQDATNIDGAQIHLKDAFDGKYTVFGSFSWTPTFDIGSGQYSFLYYHQPSVEKQPEKVDGWSFNMQQNMGDKWVVFGRINGSSGGAVPVKNSYAAGFSFLNPLERNPLDAITMGMAYNRLSPKGLDYPDYMRNSEMALELQWVWGIGKHITITPDLQIYPHAGLDGDRGVGTVVALRTTIML